MNPQIVSSFDGGRHNADLTKSINRLAEQGAYRNLSTILIVPALGSIPTKAVAAWWNMYFPPNQPVVKMFAVGMEVGAAYTTAIENILANPQLADFKYLLTLEHDNIPSPDAAVKILAQLDHHPELSAVGGLYFTKGEGGVPQIWGNPREHPINFKPQAPIPNALVECCGTGMGFTAWRLEMFKDTRLRQPWFRTTSDQQSGCFTQDLYFWHDARKYGYRCAIDCAVPVGHYDATTDIVW